MTTEEEMVMTTKYRKRWSLSGACVEMQIHPPWICMVTRWARLRKPDSLSIGNKGLDSSRLEQCVSHLLSSQTYIQQKLSNSAPGDSATRSDNKNLKQLKFSGENRQINCSVFT
jgi:hypothetical protein